jgi:peptide deformylase
MDKNKLQLPSTDVFYRKAMKRSAEINVAIAKEKTMQIQQIPPVSKELQMELVTYPHLALRITAQPVVKVDDTVKLIAANMLSLMYAGRGMGLSGNQVNYPYRLIVINASGKQRHSEQEHVFVNPVILHRSGGTATEIEGCLSLPGEFGRVRRAKEIELHAYTLDGEEISRKFSGVEARVLQHECDHLSGVLFLDKLH